MGTGALGLAACTSGGGTSGESAESTIPDLTSPATSPASSEAPGTTASTSVATDPAVSSAPLPTDPPADDGVMPLSAADFDGLAICTLVPSTPAGPFPTIDQLDRRDVTENYPGHPLRLALRVVDEGCTAIPDARLEIWHTDATGDYSSYEDGGSGKDEGSGSTFMRGFQTSDADGITEFMTIYPGWYSGRVVHIHVRVYVGGDRVLTTQLYFDDGYTDAVLATGVYAEFGPQDTTWADDGLIGANPATDGSEIVLRPAETDRGFGTLGLANIGVPT